MLHGCGYHLESSDTPVGNNWRSIFCGGPPRVAVFAYNEARLAVTFVELRRIIWVHWRDGYLWRNSGEQPGSGPVDDLPVGRQIRTFAELSLPKTRSNSTSGLFTGASRGRRSRTAGAGSTSCMAVRTRGGSCSHRAGVFPDLGRLQVGKHPLQSENNSSNRPPLVAVMQSADLRQFHDRPQLRLLNRSAVRCIFLQ